MSAIRFNQVWVALLMLATASAFFIPQKYTNKIRNLQGLFTPVAAPTRRIVSAIDRKIAKPDTTDTRQLADVRLENQRLLTELMGLTGQLEDLKHINAERFKVGALRDLCTPMNVIGNGTDAGESLMLGATSDVILERMPVVYSGGLVGRIDRAGKSGAQVKLVTDRSFKAIARFAYFKKLADGKIESDYRPTEQAVAEGDGKGGIIVHGISAIEAKHILLGDHLVLVDVDWPICVHGQRIGQVIEKAPKRAAPLYMEIKLKPLQNLKELPEVMVVTKN